MKGDMRRSRTNAHAALRHHCLRAPDRNRNAWCPGFLCQVERPFLEWQQAPIFRTRSFDKRSDVHALCERTTRSSDAFLRAFLRPSRSTGINSPCRNAQPSTGMCISDRFRNADVRPGIFGMSAGGSRFETWFAMNMHAVFAGTKSRPFTSTRMRARKYPVRTIIWVTL